MSDPRLEALLAEAVPPPLPAGLADRVVAAATALPQEQRAARARRTSGRDRRGAWLRRPLLGGAIALGLAFSGAVAATLAGVPLPAKVEAVMAQIPFVGRKTPEPEHAAVRHAAARPAPRPAPAAPPPPATAAAEPPPVNLLPRPAELRRMMLANQIVARRQALGLPTPPVAQVERMIQRRQMLRRWQRATPEQRQAFLANHPHFAAMLQARAARGQGTPEQRQAFLASHPRAQMQIEQRRALRNATPEQRQAFLAAHPEARARVEQRQALRDATPEQREAFLAAHPELRARMEQRQALRNATPEQRQAFLAAHPEIRARIAQRQALRDATPEQREAFFAAHPRARARFEARQAARQGVPPPPR